MIFNGDILFLHVPKMAGMSITRFLLNNLRGDIHLVVPEMAFEHARNSAEFDDVLPRLHLHAGIRHENYAQAERLLAELGFLMAHFNKILAVIRNPYTLEQSHFLHLRKPSTLKRRTANGKLPRIDVRLASEGDFRAFCREAPFFGKLPSRIERFYSPDGRSPPDNLSLLRFESLEQDLLRELIGFTLSRTALGHQNPSRKAGKKNPELDMTYDPAAEQAVFRKFEYLFNFYPRSVEPTQAS